MSSFLPHERNETESFPSAMKVTRLKSSNAIVSNSKYSISIYKMVELSSTSPQLWLLIRLYVNQLLHIWQFWVTIITILYINAIKICLISINISRWKFSWITAHASCMFIRVAPILISESVSVPIWVLSIWIGIGRSFLKLSETSDTFYISTI